MKFWRRVKFLFQFRKSIPFLVSFFRSREVKGVKKGGAVLLAFLYILFPWDLIPDFLVLFGIIDDVAVLTFILQQIVKMAPESLKEEYKLEDEV
ncbi:YkvA family protein [Salimicrobium flavidum]|uniref:Uncharacterized membrane protein YkvA, DUF1232 family n=1 Tax=Salimicrobium flavidum TaxID=570947 RepID=A0A1N7K6P8_9BACI|nr:DUF1232 domain-containing protein [Salimicrobium flavidum]SIS57104.1 Uncharacterized membrane protein YkvA, DUF1232 family [Salimicrobium flavidum]